MSTSIESVNVNYTPEHTAGNSTSAGSGVYDFMIAFCIFAQATSLLQGGESDLAASIGQVVSFLNAAKDRLLIMQNNRISQKIYDLRNASGDDLTKGQLAIADLQATYKLWDTEATTGIQSLSPVSQQDTDETTAIAQNNAQIYQVAMYMLSIASTLIQLMKAA